MVKEKSKEVKKKKEKSGECTCIFQDYRSKMLCVLFCFDKALTLDCHQTKCRAKWADLPTTLIFH
jgi:hypothetical protein